MRVVLFHNMVAPYRHALFRELADRVELQVWYSTLITRDRSWSTGIPRDYPHRLLRNRELRAFGRTLILCPGLLGELRRDPPDALISVLTRSNAWDTLRLCNFGRRSRIPVVLWVGAVENAGFADPVPRPVRALFELSHRLALRRAAGFLYYSERSRAWAERRGGRGPYREGTQVLEEHGEPPRLDVPVNGRDLTALFVGNLEKRKGLDLLLHALAELPPVFRDRLSLRVIGDGPLGASIRLERGAGVKVSLSGSVPRERLWDAYREADFLVLPSRHDPWGFVTNEAMSVGTPVLASVHAGSSALAARAGWCFDPLREDSFVAGLMQAAAECRRRPLRESAVTEEALYRPAPCARKIRELLEELVPSSRRRGRG